MDKTDVDRSWNSYKGVKPDNFQGLYQKNNGHGLLSITAFLQGFFTIFLKETMMMMSKYCFGTNCGKFTESLF
jgi:hypothetical protein